MSKPQKAQYSLVRLIRIFTLLPLPVLYVFSSMLSFLLLHIFKYRIETVSQNLKKAFPEKTQTELKRIRRKFYLHFCDVAIEIGKSLHWDKDRIMKHFRFRNEEILLELINKGKPVILVTGHYGNWEWLSGYPHLPGTPVLPVYKELNDPAFDQMFLHLRTRLGTEPIQMKQVLRRAYQHFSSGRPALFCFLADQSPVRDELEFFTPFLNQQTPVFLGPEKIARKYGFPVLFLAIRKQKRGQYTGEFRLITEYPEKTAAFEITRKHVALLEDLIREHPEYWIWSHKRWKFAPEDILKKRFLYAEKNEQDSFQ